MTDTPRYLRRTIDPYLGTLVILALVSAGVWAEAFAIRSWQMALAVPVIWALFGVQFYISSRYRISWTGEAIRQQAGGGGDVRIAYGDITRVASEFEVPSRHGPTRPMRRIAIYAGQPRHKQTFIDISLKHFAADDIAALMREIQSRRPDLTLPPQA
ncbi:MAG TPA: hypothetical protein VHU87_06100 [Rhizomicrobium sp.]|nr:hypothetical protein [Rhizomicrobium sp.]